MDVEQVKKVNELAKELLNHGMASSLDEAVDKAKEMLNKDIVSAPKPMVERPVEKSPDMTWQQAMAKNNEYIVKLLKEFQQKLDAMHAKIEEIAKRPVQQIQPQPVQRKIEVPSSSNNNNSSAEKKEPHARSGSFSPGSDDVAVDKIFYFGNK